MAVGSAPDAMEGDPAELRRSRAFTSMTDDCSMKISGTLHRVSRVRCPQPWPHPTTTLCRRR
eukprot:5578033-Prymnesium_polylepis.1